MPLPVGHALAAASVVALLRPRLWPERPTWGLVVVGLAAVTPDLDYGLNLVLGGGHHHGFTHSLVFAAAAGLVLAAALRRRATRPADVGVLALAMATHPVLDLMFTRSSGVELLWPFTGARYRLRLRSPLFYEVEKEDALTFLRDVAWASLKELIAYGVLFALAWFAGRRVWRGQA